jgi:hypothetical protein
VEFDKESENLGKWKLARPCEGCLAMFFARGFIIYVENPRNRIFPDSYGSISRSVHSVIEIMPVILELFAHPPPVPYCTVRQIRRYTLVDSFGIDNLYWHIGENIGLLSPEMRKRWEDYYDERVLGVRKVKK